MPLLGLPTIILLCMWPPLCVSGHSGGYLATDLFPVKGPVMSSAFRRIVINVGDAILEMPGQSVINLHRGYLRTIDLIIAASAALHESGRAKLPESPPDVGDPVLWTFERQYFPRRRRLRVRVGASGYVHAGVTRADGRWDPVYNVPLTPVPDGAYEAVLPSDVDAFTFFWTEAPWIPGHPGHWETGPRGGRVFKAAAAPAAS